MLSDKNNNAIIIFHMFCSFHRYYEFVYMYICMRYLKKNTKKKENKTKQTINGAARRVNDYCRGRVGGGGFSFTFSEMNGLHNVIVLPGSTSYL